jgi:hypothetical protein
MIKITRPAVLFVALLLAAAVTHTQTHDRRDGNWWIDLTPAYKASYITGFFDGMQLGNEFSYWDLVQLPDTTGALEKATASYDHYQNQFMKEVTNTQLAEGLSTFYGDYRNRRISMHSAVWLVLNSIAGTPQDKLDLMIQNYRRTAAP